MNTATTGGNQQLPAVASDRSGNFVVVWEDGASGGQVNAQSFSASGAPASGQFTVNTAGAGGNPNPSVAMNASGNFVVSWESGGSSVYVKTYSASGVAQTADVLVTNQRNGSSSAPVAMAADGSFVVAYVGSGTSANKSIYLQRFDPTGAAVGAASLVSGASSHGKVTAPSVAIDAEGDAVVAWVDTTSGSLVKAALAPAAMPVAAEFQVASLGADQQSQPSVGVDALGNFVIAFINSGNAPGVYCGRFAASGASLDTGPNLISSPNNVTQSSPAVAVREDGSYLIAWTAGNNLDGNNNGVFARSFNADGSASSSQFLVNTTTQNNQQDAAVAFRGGNAVVAWDGNGPGDSNGVFVQRYTMPQNVNQPPIITAPGQQTTQTNSTLRFSAAAGNAIAIADIDSYGGLETVRLDASNGTLSLSGTQGLSFTSGTGTSNSSMIFTGRLTAIDAALDGMTFVGASGYLGPASIQIQANDQGNTGSGGAQTTTASVAVAVDDAPPQVATPAAATPSPVTGNTANLSVLGSDPSGEQNLTYTWTTVGTPPAALTYSLNASNAAKSTTATFTKAGAYRFLVTITDAEGSSATSPVTVSVSQTLTSIGVAPSSVTLDENARQQFIATAYDQFAAPLSPQPTFAWSIASGGGAVTSAGLYTAPGSGVTGPVSLAATSGAVHGNASIQVVNATPTVAAPASASPATVTAATTTLSVLGADDGGESNLSYRWATTGMPPAAVSFSANGTNAAKNTVATFTKAGAYSFVVTVTDALGAAVTSSVNVMVSQTATIVSVSPTAAALNLDATRQFTVAARDQFGAAIVSPQGVAWSVSGVGSVSPGGLYTSGAAPGTATVNASIGAASSPSSAVTVTNATPTVAAAATASSNPVDSTSVALSALGADDGGEGNLTYTWATTGSVPAAVSFSGNGTNAAKNTVATFTSAGNYTFRVTIRDAQGASVSSSVGVTVNAALSRISVSPPWSFINEYTTQNFAAVAYDQFDTALASQPVFTWSVVGVGTVTQAGLLGLLGQVLPGGSYNSGGTPGAALVGASFGGVTGLASVWVANAAPTIATPAAASPNPVAGASTALSVLGADSGGEQNLTYTWTTIGNAPAAVAFSSNGTNASKNTIATFTRPGNYTFRVTVADPGGLTATSTVSVAVNPTLTTIDVSPGSATTAENGRQQFSAAAIDQFGSALVPQPAFVWTLPSGTGSVSSSGVYTAMTTPGAATVRASSGSVSGSATVTVINAAPTVVTAAAASPAVVTGTNSTLSALGTDDGGEANLVYSWALQGSAPAPVSFSVNGTNAAKNTTATFSKPGTYNFRVTMTDAGGLNATSTVTVVVNATLSSLIVSPGSVTLNEGGQQQFTAVALDQFGGALPTQPSFAWGLPAGVGSIDAGGRCTAPLGPGTATVRAATGGVRGYAAVTVANGAPTVAQPAAASPSAVTATTTQLSVLGADDGGEPNLVYTWATTGPTPGQVAFSANRSNAAKTCVATFAAPGAYTFQVTMTDADGLSTTSTVGVTVSPTLNTIAVTPTSASVVQGQGRQLIATAYDQFGNVLAAQPQFTWAITTGMGAVDPTGTYTAAAQPEADVVTASSGVVSGSASIQVVGPPNHPPVLSLPITLATPKDTPLLSRSADGDPIFASDPDAGGGSEQLTINVTHGSLTLSGMAGLSFSQGTGVGDTAMTFTGTIGAINAALEGARFTPAPRFTGAAAIRFTLTDQGNTGSGGPQSVIGELSINVTPVANDPPSVGTTPGAAPFTDGAGPSLLTRG